MTKKRRVFDIEMPEADPGPQISSLDEPKRRSPMASAISENAGAMTERAAAEARIRAENDSLAHEYVALKKAGLVTRMIPVDDILTEALVRDRKKGDDEDLPELVASIRDVGLSNPIRVEERADGRYELIQGYRRMTAYRMLQAEEGDTWAEIPAAVLPRGEGIAGLYRQMVDENLVRRDLSFAEMANVARAYSADPDTPQMSVEDAVAELFKSAAYNKRSYIRSFARLMEMADKQLTHAEHLPRNLGLALLKRLEAGNGALARLAAHFDEARHRTPEEEVALVRSFVGEEPEAPPQRAEGDGPKTARRPRTTFDLRHAGERVKCTAGEGQLTLKLDRDLTGVDRRRLEQGIALLLDTLDGS
ncbi:MAG: ParB N-terminal domain-containing protein [Paracoccaceae bacterium]